MEIANVSFRIDAKLKKEAESLFNEMGMTMTTAFNIFLRQTVRERRLPFIVSTQNYNPETLAAFEESERLLRDKNAKSYSVEEAFKELEKCSK